MKTQMEQSLPATADASTREQHLSNFIVDGRMLVVLLCDCVCCQCIALTPVGVTTDCDGKRYGSSVYGWNAISQLPWLPSVKEHEPVGISGGHLEMLDRPTTSYCIQNERGLQYEGCTPHNILKTLTIISCFQSECLGAPCIVVLLLASLKQPSIDSHHDLRLCGLLRLCMTGAPDMTGVRLDFFAKWHTLLLRLGHRRLASLYQTKSPKSQMRSQAARE